MKKPKISIIIAVYNSATYLSDCIDSILGQSFTDFELIMVDDNSNDKSTDIIKKYQDERIILIRNSKNLGSAGARNNGIKQAKGKYIAIIDSDDVMLKDRLKIQYDYLEKNPDVFLVGGRWIWIDESGNKIKNKKVFAPTKNVNQMLEIKNCIHNPTIMFRNEGYLYREKIHYAEDYDLFLNMLSDGKKLTNILKKLIKYRLNPKSITHTKKLHQLLFMTKSKEFYLERKNCGKDTYDKFSPTEIFSIDPETSTDKQVLELDIRGQLELNKLNGARKSMNRFFKLFGMFNKPIYLLYYCATLSSPIYLGLKSFYYNKIKKWEE